MRRTSGKGFIAAVKYDYLDQMDEVAERLKAKGCDIRKVLKLTGVITGRLKTGVNINDLNVEGIASVAKERPVRKS